MDHPEPSGVTAPTSIVVCLKRVPTRVDVDQLSGAVGVDDRFTGVSPADQSALEWALELGATWGVPVAAVSVGDRGVNSILAEAIAVGADIAVRIPTTEDDSPDHDPPTSAAVGEAIARAFPAADLFVCGDYSLDRGTGSVPAYIAHHRSCAQALGLVSLRPTDVVERSVLAERRLDQGRREWLRADLPAVVSVEGGRELRRASLPALLAARSAQIEIGAATVASWSPPRSSIGPYRPRARVVPGPEGDTNHRIRALTGSDIEQTSSQIFELEPDDAARVVHERLVAWGQLPS